MSFGSLVGASAPTSSGSGGDVVGPASSTDNALARFDGTTGKLLQNSNTTLSDAGLLVLANPVNEFQGANVASATTTNIGAATGNYINITGTTQIDAFDTIQAGTRRVLNFNGILQLTYNGTSMILPTGANITTAAGDTATFISLGSGNWICTQYQRADGTALASSGSGDVVGPASALNNSIAVYDGTTGKLIKDSLVAAARGTTSLFVSNTIPASFTGSSTTAFGYGALAAATTAPNCTAIGTDAMQNLTVNANNTGVGAFVLRDASAGSMGNTAMGLFALGDGTGIRDNNCGFGMSAGRNVTTGLGNCLFGYQAGNAITTGSYNLIFGYDLDPPSATANGQVNFGGVIQGFSVDGTVPGVSMRLAPTPGTDLTASGLTGSVTVDTNAVGIGAALFLAADGRYDEADADAAATMPCTAVALETSTGTKSVLFHGFIRNDAWNWTPGGTVYVSTTQGTFTQTAPSGSGDQIQAVGVAQSADVIYFNPSMNFFEVP